MKSAFEIIVQDILPAARALVAKKLIDSYGLSQKQTAERLGLSQPAISQYKRDLRGARVHIVNGNPQMLEKIDYIARKVANNELNQTQVSLEICGLYRLLKPEDITNVEEYVEG